MGQLGRDATRGQRAHAVVVGAGMAGLLAARVLAGHFEQVTVVDRDRLPEHPRFRPGVPQSRHLHVLLGHGLECLEQLFPGFEAGLVAAGAPVVGGSESPWLKASTSSVTTGPGSPVNTPARSTASTTPASAAPPAPLRLPSSRWPAMPPFRPGTPGTNLRRPPTNRKGDA